MASCSAATCSYRCSLTWFISITGSSFTPTKNSKLFLHTGNTYNIQHKKLRIGTASLVIKKGRLRWFEHVEQMMVNGSSFVWWWRWIELDTGDSQGRHDGMLSRRIWKVLACLKRMHRFQINGERKSMDRWLIQVHVKMQLKLCICVREMLISSYDKCCDIWFLLKNSF